MRGYRRCDRCGAIAPDPPMQGHPIVLTFIDGQRLCGNCMTDPGGPEGQPEPGGAGDVARVEARAA